ncbi:methylated-DNA--[protein]-cysteine S-methyltransferase [Pelodictyon luteolum]|uniref:methylated-DNA--[protein]-cysteine S-methyltransferase n=1 Tax=Pelodictyon luteolum TaxID=1100 RepID=UPI0002DA9D0E|nr:methylated-DNA--[protein]-cysteine S-methyltransferase [Pelodictyon luteolum]
MHLYFRHTLIGTIGIAERRGAICNLYFQQQFPYPDAALCRTDLLQEAFRQLDAWLAGSIRTFSLPLEPAPTPFARCVREALLCIPPGAVSTYSGVAEAILHPHAARAVGSACSRNPLPLFIPCHRVVPASGGTGLYRGGAALKSTLLELEQRRTA